MTANPGFQISLDVNGRSCLVLGGDDEAVCAVSLVLPAWKRTAGALDWLARARARLELPKAGRNEPCPCGSGKKYKKCCAV